VPIGEETAHETVAQQPADDERASRRTCHRSSVSRGFGIVACIALFILKGSLNDMVLNRFYLVRKKTTGIETDLRTLHANVYKLMGWVNSTAQRTTIEVERDFLRQWGEKGVLRQGEINPTCPSVLPAVCSRVFF
jgi:hypothetical protein